MRIIALSAALLLALLWICKSLMPGSVGDYQLTEIRSQGNTLLLLSLNDNGQVAGSISGQGTEHAIIWNADTGITILATPDGHSSLAEDINNSGQVCGDVRDPNNKSHACFWDSEGRMHDIGTLGGRVSIAEGLNDRGQVVGWAQTSANVMHAFLWTKEDGIVDLDTRSALHSFAEGINNQGQVVGHLCPTPGQHRAFLWQKETGMIDVHDKLKGTESIACGINDTGRIIGSYLTENNLSHAFVWDQSRGFKDLRIVSEQDWGCTPQAITNGGQAVAAVHRKRIKKFGFVVQQESTLSFLFNRRLRRLYLHEALPFETNHFIAYDMNNKGQVIASARKAQSTIWYLMTPVDSARQSARKSE